MYIWLKWKIEIITADHEGYCSGADNSEDISYEYKYYKYEVSIDEYETLIWLWNECPNFFNDNYLIGASKPYVPNEHLNLYPLQSGYCYPSKNNLLHEIQSTPIEIVDFVTENDGIGMITDSYVLKKYMEPVIDKNNILNQCFGDIFPLELTNIILKYLWNSEFK